MARTRTFDPEAALDAAMRTFWQNGFGGTTYDDLVAATGVSRKGLYTAFGDKNGLFVASLRHYRLTVVATLFAVLDAPDVTLDDIRGLLRRIGALSRSKDGARGCLMANTAADEIVRDPAIKAEIDLHLKHLTRRFRTALKRAGVAAKRADRLGAYLTGTVQALLLFAHAQADRSLVDPFLKEALRALD